ncbi:STM4015 family protein [Desulfogranum japonicum]|uniref:STM4015 family protein n=1 Tax=Desulfogranum japonicum TaxID=231447 RepID=UPI000401CFBF|nr:STM4015 family protein [Desulfogranum japonicum]
MSIETYIENFHGLKVKEYNPKEELADAEEYAWRLSISWEEAEKQNLKISQKFAPLFNDPAVQQIQALVIGPWGEEWEENPQEVINLLIKNKEALKALKALFVGDITYEDCEMSWIQQGDYSELLKAYPGLEELRIRGAAIRLGNAGHAGLKKLIVESGGLSSTVPHDICTSTFPELTHLELWLGVEEYGFDGSMETIKKCVAAFSSGKLTYLGLKNSEIVDDIAKFLADHDILSTLDVLDLSLGTLTDEGAQALLDSKKIRSLKQLILRHHYMSKGMCKKLASLPVDCDCSAPQEAEEYDGEIYRTVFVSE